MVDICYIGNAHNVHVKRWTAFFSNRGYNIYIITHEGFYDPEEGWKYPKHSLDFYKQFSNVKLYFVAKYFKRILQTRKLLLSLKPDIVHAHSAFGQGFFGAFANYHPYIISCWGWDIRVIPNKSFLHREAVKYALRKADIIHVQDKLSKKIVEELSTEYKNKLFVKAWGVNLKEFNEGNRDESIIKKHSLGGPIVISVRNLTKKYDIETLFRAMPYVVKELPNVKFMILNDGYLKGYFKEMVRKAGIEKNVDFVGFVSFEKYKRYLASADLFIDTFYPHDMRGGQMFGQGLLEAMASGVATLVANRPTIYEYKGKEKWYFGYVFKGGDEKDLAMKMIELLLDDKKRKEIKEKNMESIKKRFNWEKNMTEIEKELYKKWL